MDFTTPALIFPAISLLLLAYTNRFAVLAQLIRQLHSNNRDKIHGIVIQQIKNLQTRIKLTKAMQFFGVLSFMLCTISMLALFLEEDFIGKVTFIISLILLTISLFTSLWEIYISGGAINLELQDIEQLIEKSKKGKLP